jgi:hypothetical protein
MALDVGHGATPRSSTPSLRLRLRVWWRRLALTRELAAGEDPDTSDELTLVARDLIGAHTHQRLAGALELAIRKAQQGRGVRASLNRRDVLHAHAELTALAQRLRDDTPVPVQGVAMVAVLVTDGAGPMYNARAAETVGSLAEHARERLDDPIG